MSLKRKRGFLRPEEEGAEVKPEKWGLPDYTSEVNKEAKETAFNYDPGWTSDFNETEPEVPVLPTEAEIEEIINSAHQEGYLKGQEAGFNSGYEKGKEKGFKEGHAEGMEQGQVDGVAAGEEQIKQQADYLISLADQLAGPLELMNAQVEKQLVEMVLSLTKEVVHIEAQTNPQIILDTIKESVEALPVAGHAITLKLHPEDADIIRQAYGEQELDNRNWTLLTEPALNRGDVQIDAAESSVNYKMEERIRSVIQSFCGVNRFKEGE